MLSVSELAGYIDAYLKVRTVPDDPRAINGLQVDADRAVSRIAVAVDACDATIELAIEAGASFLLVHHGLFWAGSAPIAGALGRKVRRLVSGGLSLYSAHLPLDCHPEVGNNHVLARRLEITGLEPFGHYEKCQIGVVGEAHGSVDDLATAIHRELGVTPKVIAKGGPTAGRTAIVTGAGSGHLAEAVAAGVNTFLTGEGPHHTYLLAEELGINLIYAGHYATETVGVQALAGHLETKFRLPWQFLDHPTGM